MQDDTSADVQADDDIADLPLFGEPEAAQAAPEAPSETTAEAKDTGVDTEAAEDSDKPATEAKDTEATAEDEAKADDSTTTNPDSTEDKGKPDPAAAYRAYQERQQTRQAVAKQIEDTYAPKSQDELYEEAINNGLTEEQAAYEARIQAVEARAEFREQQANIAELNSNMQAEAVNVLNDFPVFDPKSPDYDADFTNMVQQTYQTAARLQTDENGIVLSAELPLYDYHKQMAAIYNRGASKGAQQGQAEMQDMLAKTEAVGSGSPGSRGAETLDEMYERLADVPLA